MNASVQPPSVFMLPETAPFSPEQRAWLGGFFAALAAPGTAPMPVDATAGAVGSAKESGLADNDDAPWHDPAMPLAERQALATGRPLAPRLMAAMAQQDCGQCGYTCAAYANALATGAEARLNLCAPGGKDTFRAVKVLAAEIGVAASPSMAAAPAEPAAASAGAVDRGYSREAPVDAVFVGRRRLNGPGSEKETFHIELDLAGTGVSYAAGDSLGVFAVNAPGLVDAVIAQLGARPEGLVAGRSLHDVLSRDLSLGAAPDALFQLFSYVTGGALRQKARALAAGEDPDGDATTLDVLGALHKFGVRPSAEAFVEALDPLQPRLYSISSSPKANPGRVSLTVDAVRYTINRRGRFGVASTFLGERVSEGARIPVYVQRAHGFGVPPDPATPLIMIGPGTGIAPFRAFLQERAATQAPGRNWLFFGHQRRDHDFFYESELNALKSAGVLTRLSLAWSRDGAEKFYVQDRMREVGAELFAWLEEGAHVAVCGDAKRMAKDVERALVDIVELHGGRPAESAVAYVAALKKAGRYQADVY
ncbi:sulfite reductase subunit alpha [Rhodoplanes sp. TEM]|uniref:Sulfite reductase subunit alpha n=1 Tax=Rhodoplanes tepidamans TaxID=200616 RepID=A0ABT5J5D6_RHOTP|nr:MULTISPECIES: sulfite reductase subunit alpha [Rhodoplanes]MDC7784847.1 sulfite reductase subunit alpha [Rhodoplanes tepidamans]MDC7982314.1 sulfite reductase subunit alpha [Rhodoplanes sp. TEM]MDQ0356323.1 sulfite reductase (NADPH) flavoprotein alpha-component [Rhodoplanes tepidamans]